MSTHIRKGLEYYRKTTISQNLEETLTDCYIAPSIVNLFDHIIIVCTFTLSNICSSASCNDENTPLIEPNTEWGSATDEQISFSFLMTLTVC